MMFRGRLFSGRLFAGQLFGREQQAPQPEQTLSGYNPRARRIRKNDDDEVLILIL